MRATSVSTNGRALWRHARPAALVVCVCGGLLAASAAPAAAATYTMTDLGSLGAGNTEAYGISNNGQVTGESFSGKKVKVQCFEPSQKGSCFVFPEHPFLWKNGTITDLGTLGGTRAAGQAINNAGEVAGWSNLPDSENINAFLDRNGQMTSLGALLPGGESFAFAINESGAVAGKSTPNESGSSYHAFLEIAGKMQDLGLIPGGGGTYSEARGVNNADEVVGVGDSAAGEARAWLYANGKMTDLGTLGGPIAEATAINNSGQIVGRAQTSTDADHGFIYQNSKMTDLGLNVEPEAINDSGVIVGQAPGGAFIDSGGQIQNLNNLVAPGSGFELEDATGINKSGQIIVNARRAGHAFLLTPAG
jgi:probable HAF family extracellular repeat protein